MSNGFLLVVMFFFFGAGLAGCGAQPEAARVVPERPVLAADANTYTNPLSPDLADPDVLVHDGRYYVYGTTIDSLGFLVWESADLVHWTPRGLAFGKSHDSWAIDSFWAPCVIEQDGKFLMYYSARGPTERKKYPRDEPLSFRLCLAVADSPLGPFRDLENPLFDFGHATIDAQVFVDEDGQGYLYYSRDISENPTSDIYVLPLTDDLRAVEDGAEPTLCITPSQSWEGREWNEAPFVFRAGDTYVLMYSARYFQDPLYAVGYATAPSPLGPWTKAPDNPLLSRTQKVSGPGHNCVVRSPDGSELFLVYHAHKHLGGGYPRELCIDRLRVVPDEELGVRLETDGPTRSPQPIPSGAVE